MSLSHSWLTMPRALREWVSSGLKRRVATTAGQVTSKLFDIRNDRPARDIVEGEERGKVTGGLSKPLKDIHNRPTSRIPFPTADDTDRRVTGTVEMPHNMRQRATLMLRKEQRSQQKGILKMTKDIIPSKDEVGLELPFSRGGCASQNFVQYSRGLSDFYCFSGEICVVTHCEYIFPGKGLAVKLSDLTCRASVAWHQGL